MDYINVGNSDVKISRIVFGAWAIGGWMWGGNDDVDAVAAIHASIEAGITSFDTAPVYGFGHSENLVAKALKNIPRDRVQILTKCGLRWDTDQGTFYFDSVDNQGKPLKIMRYGGKDGIMQEVEESLRRLNTDYIDLYQLHWPDTSTPISETMETMDRLIQSGKIRAIGVCNYSGDQMQEAELTAILHSNQVPYSMVKRDVEKDVVPYALKNGNAVLAYSPLQRGLLTGKITKDYVFEDGDHRPSTKFFKEPNLSRTNEMLHQIKPIADGHAVTLGQLVISWTLEQPGITAALVGARNAKQVKENAKAAEIRLSDDEIKQINQAIDGLSLD